MKPHIAIIDDEPRLAEVLAMVLRRRDYQVTTYHNPLKCIHLLKEVNFDLIMTDLRMPEMDGLQVLEQVRAELPDVPVILITAHATVQTAISAMRHGAYDYVEKPFDNDLCIGIIEKALVLHELPEKIESSDKR